MNGFRILVVEDEEQTRSQLVALFKDAFPDSHVVDAATVGEAREHLEAAAAHNQPFDAAVLDFRLPQSTGHYSEVDESLCESIRGQMPQTLVTHITAYSDDQKIAGHVARTHPPRGPFHRSFDKLGDPTWASQLLGWVRRHLYSARIERAIENLFGRPGPAPKPDESVRFGDLGVCASITTPLALLVDDIRAHWKYLDEDAKRRVLTQFEVNDTGDLVRVTLR